MHLDKGNQRGLKNSTHQDFVQVVFPKRERIKKSRRCSGDRERNGLKTAAGLIRKIAGMALFSYDY